MKFFFLSVFLVWVTVMFWPLGLLLILALISGLSHESWS